MLQGTIIASVSIKDRFVISLSDGLSTSTLNNEIISFSHKKVFVINENILLSCAGDVVSGLPGFIINCLKNEQEKHLDDCKDLLIKLSIFFIQQYYLKNRENLVLIGAEIFSVTLFFGGKTTKGEYFTFNFVITAKPFNDINVNLSIPPLDFNQIPDTSLLCTATNIPSVNVEFRNQILSKIEDLSELNTDVIIRAFNELKENLWKSLQKDIGGSTFVAIVSGNSIQEFEIPYLQ